MQHFLKVLDASLLMYFDFCRIQMRWLLAPYFLILTYRKIVCISLINEGKLCMMFYPNGSLYALWNCEQFELTFFR